MKYQVIRSAGVIFFTAAFSVLITAGGVPGAESGPLDFIESGLLPPAPSLKGKDTGITPTPTPSPSSPAVTPGSPTPTPEGLWLRWVPPADLFSAFGPGVSAGILDKTGESQDVTVTRPGRPRLEFKQYQKTAYDPHKKTIAYPLLEDAYKAVYKELLGITLTTPSPPPPPQPTPSTTPAGFKTPSPSPAPTGTEPPPTPLPTPTYIITPVPTITPARTATPAPSASPTPTPTPTPGTFDLVTTLFMGVPFWSVFADENYVYGGADDGNVYLWERSGFCDFTNPALLDDGTDRMYSVFSSQTTSGKYLYGANRDNRVYIWKYDFLGGDFSIFTELSGGGYMYSVFADAGRIYGANADRNIYVWDLADFNPLTSILAGDADVYSVYGDDNYIYGANNDNFIYVWNRNDFAYQTSFSPATDVMWSVNADTDYVIAGCSDGNAYVWNSGFVFQTSLSRAGDGVGSVYSDDRKYFYAGSRDSDVYIWSIPAFNPHTRVLDEGTGSVNCVFADRYAPGDAITHYIFGANHDGNIYVWLAERTPTPTSTPTATPTPTGTPTPVGYKTPSPAPTDVSGESLPSPTATLPAVPSPTATPLSGASATPTPEGYATPSAPSPSPTPSPQGGFAPAAPTPLGFTLRAVLSEGEEWMDGVFADADYIYGANEDRGVYVWDRSDFSFKKRLSFPNSGLMLSVFADSDYIYASSDDSYVYIWNRSDFSFKTMLAAGGSYAESVFADAAYLYAANADSSLYIWQRSDFTPLPALHDARGWLTSVYADGERIYGGTGGMESDLYVWDRNTFTLLAVLSGAESDLSGVKADSDYIYGASADNNLYIWNRDYSLKKVLRHGSDQMTGVDPEGDYLYASSHDGRIYVWRKPRFTFSRRLQAGDKPFQSVYADGDLILGASQDSNIYVWQAPAEREEREPLSIPFSTPDSSLWSQWWVTPTPAPGRSKGSGGGSSSAQPTPVRSVVELPEQAQLYDSHKKTIAYPLLEDTYKKAYEEFFGIILTTPTPPPTPVATATPEAAATGSPGGPTPEAQADVVFNEIAWMGTEADELDEWIELYNNTSSAKSLSAWKIRTSSGDTINLSGTINGNSYFLIERNENATSVLHNVVEDFALNNNGERMELLDEIDTVIETVNCSSGWFAGDNNTKATMERVDPAGGPEASNWKTWDGSTYNGFDSLGNRINGTVKAKNSVTDSVSGAVDEDLIGSELSLETSGAKFSQFTESAFIEGSLSLDEEEENGSQYSEALIGTNISLADYADWIDFEEGRYFKLYEWDLTGRNPKTALFDYLPNTAFVYLVTGYRPSADYFKKNLLEMVRDESFDWGGNETCRYIADIAEAYLAMEVEGVFTKEEQQEIEEKLYQLAMRNRQYYNQGNYAQGAICGLNAAVGYIIGEKRGDEMISWANRLLSYDDTWTLPEDSRHCQGLFLREMLRVALYSNRMTIPDQDAWGIKWKENFARQIDWILATFPHNGFCPAYGREYRQNYVDHYMMPLAVATSQLSDGSHEHLRLAREAKWLLQKMFLYGKDREVSPFGQNAYGYEAAQWGPFAILLNPVYLWWYLNEGITPLQPSAQNHGSQVVYRPRLPYGDLAGVYDEKLSELKTQLDKIVHRSSWGDKSIFLMLDPSHPAANNGENKYSFANNIVSLSYGPEEFLSGLTLNFKNGSKTRANVADILGNYTSAELLSWEDTPGYSRSLTRVRDGRHFWLREITLFKEGEEKIEVKDTLSRRGSVYWHFQGEPSYGDDRVVLELNGTRLEVSWEGVERASPTTRKTWSDPEPLNRWSYSGDPDRELRLYRSSPGTIITTIRGLTDENGSVSEIPLPWPDWEEIKGGNLRGILGRNR